MHFFWLVLTIYTFFITYLYLYLYVNIHIYIYNIFVYIYIYIYIYNVYIIFFILYYVNSFYKSKHRFSIQTILLKNVGRYFPSLRVYTVYKTETGRAKMNRTNYNGNWPIKPEQILNETK